MIRIPNTHVVGGTGTLGLVTVAASVSITDLAHQPAVQPAPTHGVRWNNGGLLSIS